MNVTCKCYSTCIDYIIYIINDYRDSIVYRESFTTINRDCDFTTITQLSANALVASQLNWLDSGLVSTMQIN